MTPQEFRDIRGKLSLSDMSSLIGVHTRTIRRWEKGTVDIPIPVQKLVKILFKNKLENILLK